MSFFFFVLLLFGLIEYKRPWRNGKVDAWILRLQEHFEDACDMSGKAFCVL